MVTSPLRVRRQYGAGDLTLRQDSAFGASRPIAYDRSGALTLETEAAQTYQSWMVEGNKGTSIISQAGITVAANISVGTADLALRAGVGGTGSLTFTAGDYDNNINTPDSAPTLTAANITLQQDAAFGATAPAMLTYTGGLVLETAAAQTLQDWMVVNNRDLSLTTGGDLTLGGTLGGIRIALGTGDLTLDAGTNSIIFDGTGLQVNITADQITLSADGTPNPVEDTELIINATSALTIDADLHVGSGSFITLMVGSGAITFIDTPTLTSDFIVTIDQVDAFATDAAPFTLDSNVQEIVLRTDAAQTTADWMFSNGVTTTIESQMGVTVAGNIDVGTGNLVLRAGNDGTGNLSFITGDHDDNSGTPDSTPTLTAASITLKQDDAFTGGATAPATLTRTGALIIVTEAAQTTQGWMFEG